jgi:hypothetical protein
MSGPRADTRIAGRCVVLIEQTVCSLTVLGESDLERKKYRNSPTESYIAFSPGHSIRHSLSMAERRVFSV